MRLVTINLSDDLFQLLKTEKESRSLESEEECLRRILYEYQQEKLENKLIELIEEGEKSGDPLPWSAEDAGTLRELIRSKSTS